MKTPCLALIQTSPHSATTCLAGTSILDRLAVLAFRAGCHEIHIHFPHPLSHRPTLKRALAWKIPVHWHSEPFPPFLHSQAHLQLSSDWLPAKEDLGSLILQGIETAQPRSLVTSAGLRTPIQYRPSQHPFSSTAPTPTQTALGVCCPLTSAEERQHATQSLWKSITSSSDGFVDRWFNRPLGRFLLSKWLIHTPFTPNQISVSSILIGVYGAWCLAQGQHSAAIQGALWFQCSAMVDCVDGDVARMVFKESKLGKWLDLAGDQIVHIAIFAGITLGLYRMNTSAPVVALGASTILGAILSFLVILRSMLRPQHQSSRLQKLIDGATSRDFSVLVLILACVGHLEWFLWMSAIGSHVFWITALSLQLSGTPPATSAGAAPSPDPIPPGGAR